MKDNEIVVNLSGRSPARVRRLRPVRFGFSLSMVMSLISFLPSVVLAASFDCLKARTRVEKLICFDPSLSELDDKLKVAFDAVMNAGNATDITAQQRKWLKERNACTTAGCVEQQYSKRLKELSVKQESSTVLRQITRPKDDAKQQKLHSAEAFLKPSTIKYPPYPDIWGVDLPKGVSVFSVHAAGNGDYVFGASGEEKSGYEWLTANHSYLMTGLFSGEQWRIPERDRALELDKNNGWHTKTKEIPCPVPIPSDDFYERSQCSAEIDYTFPNGNRLLYVHTALYGKYCYNERYFSYLVLLSPDGRTLHQVTPITVYKTKDPWVDLGDLPSCDGLNGGGEYKLVNSWATAPRIKLFMPLADNSFLLDVGNSQAKKSYFLRFDHKFNSKHPAFGKEVFMMNTGILEKMGSIVNEPSKSIHDNALQTDRKIFNYLTGVNLKGGNDHGF